MFPWSHHQGICWAGRRLRTPKAGKPQMSLGWAHEGEQWEWWSRGPAHSTLSGTWTTALGKIHTTRLQSLVKDCGPVGQPVKQAYQWALAGIAHCSIIEQHRPWNKEGMPGEDPVPGLLYEPSRKDAQCNESTKSDIHTLVQNCIAYACSSERLMQPWLITVSVMHTPSLWNYGRIIRIIATAVQRQITTKTVMRKNLSVTIGKHWERFFFSNYRDRVRFHAMTGF